MTYTCFSCITVVILALVLHFLMRQDDQPDLRVILLTYNRPESLKKCLHALDRLDMDGDTAEMDIWIDRDDDQKVDAKTLDISVNFNWTRGTVRTHVHEEKVGLFGQWMKTWQDATIVLYVEDDVDLSEFAYIWLKHAVASYMSLDRVAGISLQDEYVITSAGRARGVRLKPPADQNPAFAYPIVGPWGFAPKKSMWMDFLEWYHKSDPSFRPYTPDAQLHNKWYQDMEDAGRASSMWTMWFIHFCHLRGLSVVYPNIRTVIQNADPWRNLSLAVHRGEKGLHFGHFRKAESQSYMVSHWNQSFIHFHSNLTWVHYDGSFHN